jgi:amino acid permease
MQHNGENGNISLMISIILGIFSFLMNNFDIFVKLLVASASVAAACFAIRYHHYAAIERKQQIKINEQIQRQNLNQEKRNVNQETRNIEQEERNIEHDKKNI